MTDMTVVEKLKGRHFIIIGIFGLIFMIVEVISAFCVIGGLIDAYIGKVVLKKHFEKAGIV